MGRGVGSASIGFSSAQPIEGLASLLQARFNQGVATPFEVGKLSSGSISQANGQSCQTVVALAYPLPYSSFPEEGEGVVARSAVWVRIIMIL